MSQRELKILAKIQQQEQINFGGCGFYLGGCTCAACRGADRLRRALWRLLDCGKRPRRPFSNPTNQGTPSELVFSN